MTLLLWAHIASGLIAVIAGFVAAGARKGARLHGQAGTLFGGSMLLLGISAAILEPFRTPEPGSPVGPLLVCYFVATSWVTARRRDGTSGRFEIMACAVALGAAAIVAWSGLTGGATTPAGRGPVFAFAAICLLAGLGDLNVVLRKRLSASQRLSRHLWRMCFAFFIGTGSFFLGQQDIMPMEVRGSPILLVLGFAPLAVMIFWLVRLRFPKAVAKLAMRARPSPISPVAAS